MRTLIVGEAWGPREAEHKHALVGPTGIELASMLAEVGFAPPLRTVCTSCKQHVDFTLSSPHCPSCSGRIWPGEFDLIHHWQRLRTEASIGVTNVFNHHPPNNDLGHLFSTDLEVSDVVPWKPSKRIGGRFLKREFFPHVERLWTEVRTSRPNVVLALGNAACWALLDRTKISDLRGTFHWSTRLNVKVVPTFHPAAMMRQYSMRSTLLADIDKTRRESEWPEIRRIPRYFTIPSPDWTGIAEIRDWLLAPANAYACDIETYRSQISIIGFARDAYNALVVPFHNTSHAAFWPSAEMEVAALRLCIRGLKRPIRKIGQNFLYDLTYFARLGVLPDMSAGMDDTMLEHHARYPEMQKSLGYLASIYLDELPWKPLGRPNALKRDE